LLFFFQVTDPEILQALITGEPTSDGDTAEEMGAVQLEKGWIASMLKKPSDGTGVCTADDNK
jgi:hypothetical protein